jgi:beta-glucuronidase
MPVEWFLLIQQSSLCKVLELKIIIMKISVLLFKHISLFKTLTGVLVLLFCVLSLQAETVPLITNVEGRKTSSLNGKWNILVDPMENGVGREFFRDKKFDGKSFQSYDFDKAPTLLVPGDWNTQLEQLLYYEGTVWYRKKFNYNLPQGNRLFLHFGAVNYECIAYLNGEKLGEHVGGYTPFNFEVTKFLKEGENSIVVKVANKRYAEGVPQTVFDWWNFGGITRSVNLIETTPSYIRDYSIQLSNKKVNTIEGWIQLDGALAGERVAINIPELKITHTVTCNALGRGAFEIKAKPECWTPEKPTFYSVRIRTDFDQVTEDIAFRTIEADGRKIRLNGKELFLRGVNIHAQVYGRVAHSKEDAILLLNWAKELGCNFVRPAHYPHSEEMIKTAEQMGIMLMEEIPVYWRIHWDNPDTYENAENQLKEMIARDKNRANVIFWSISNETRDSKERTVFLSKLAACARKLDDKRLITAALDGIKTIEPNIKTVSDPLVDILDVISFNQYIGWFSGKPEDCDHIEWKFDYDKPFIMTEFGSSASAGNYGDETQFYTEEYQERYYRHTVEMIKKIPDLSGTCPWNLTEHRSPLRVLSGIEDGYSRAGLISSYGKRKKAFYIMKEWYEIFERGHKIPDDHVVE